MHDSPFELHPILEARANIPKLRKVFSQAGETVIQYSCNMPGMTKRNMYEKFFFREFIQCFKKFLYASPITVSRWKCINSEMGRIVFYSTTFNAFETKRLILEFERTELLSKYWDIDVFENDIKIERYALGVSPRKCFICDNGAKYCAMLGLHSEKELLRRIEDDLSNHQKK